MLNIAFRNRMGLQMLVIVLITVLVLIQGVPSFAQSSTLTATAGKEAGSQGGEKSTVPAQGEPIPSGQPHSGKSATDEKWKLYVNDSYNYEISYPPSAMLDSSKPAKVLIMFAVPFDTGTDELGIYIEVHDNPDHAAAKEWAYKEWGPKLEEQGFIRSEENIDLSGVHGYKIKVFGFDQDYYHIYIPKGGKMYEIDYDDPLSVPELSKTVKKRYDELFHKIVNTFRFR